MSTIRVQKVEELLREQISLLIRQNLPEELGIVTVTDVDVTSDFKLARVYIALIEKDQEDRALKSLNELAHKFQRVLGKSLDLRYTPRLSFRLDESEGKVNRVEELLQEIDRGT